MRRIAFAAVPLLAACSTVSPAEPEIPVRGETLGYTCKNEALSRFVGREATPALVTEMRQASGAKTVRLVRPGMMITMDFRNDRLTVWVDAGNRVTRANCG
jgi:23S rRNA G2445 N2-methylase RlmL